MEGAAFLGKYERQEDPKYVFAAADRFDEKTDRIRAVRDTRFKYIKNFMPKKPMYLEVNYRNQMPIMQELIRLREQNELTQEQALWFRTEKPEEELYDTWEDPHEVNNLANDPKYKEKLDELRMVMNEWINKNSDTGLQKEKEFFNEIWPGGIQPQTQKPEVNLYHGKITLSSPTPGASVGYRKLGQSDVWKVYNDPFLLDKEETIEIIAHRIGYKKSPIITFKIDQ